MRVALVGTTGVLGRALVPLLLQEGHTVRALARSTDKARRLFPQVAEIVECDLLQMSAPALSDLLADCDAVAHIATSIPNDSGAPNAWEANTRLRTDGVRVLLEACLNARVKRYLQQSITMAYPNHGDEWITEDAPLDTAPERARVCAPVIAMEQMVRAAPLDKLQWCILRGGSFVGADTHQNKLIERLQRGEEIVPCDGRNFTSLIHVADMASAAAAAIERAPAGTIFNIVDEPLRYGEYLDRLADSLRVPRAKRDGASNCPPSWRCSNRAAKDKLGWQPTHRLIP